MNKKAISLISGGLDSAVATKLIIDQGIEVVGLHFTSIFASKRDKQRGHRALETARELGIEIISKNKGDDYIEIIKNPRYGYGKNMNPCIDCRIYMLSLTREMLPEIGASFVVTGEVLGQRPMSQRRNTIELIEKRSELKGLIVRPLSAKLFPPSIPEQEGILDREKLLGHAGRGRQVQYELVEKYRLKEFDLPGGGCLLTDPIFSIKLKDLMATDPAYTTKDIELLAIGRHFRVSPSAKLIVARNERENEQLGSFAGQPYIRLEPVGFKGPRGLMKAAIPNEETFLTSARILARYGKDVSPNPTIEIHDDTSRSFSFEMQEIDSDALLIQQEAQ
ncbi:MAG: putative tRNA(5-methylaminomethyl-2-thiouridylate) methyltransferase with PP-loop ATPase domain [Deltaproteobacteria bacterium]|nr:putative tRNA(5-methylaminomethyl-2-thiouridylate) methyltransferase with PP-loop ATPase domain [Deltaproteobacteria bacterium]